VKKRLKKYCQGCKITFATKKNYKKYLPKSQVQKKYPKFIKNKKMSNQNSFFIPNLQGFWTFTNLFLSYFWTSYELFLVLKARIRMNKVSKFDKFCVFCFFLNQFHFPKHFWVNLLYNFNLTFKLNLVFDSAFFSFNSQFLPISPNYSTKFQTITIKFNQIRANYFTTFFRAFPSFSQN